MLRTRILAALVFVPVLVASVWIGGNALQWLCVGLAVVMAWEMGRIIQGAVDSWGRLDSLGAMSMAGLFAAHLSEMITFSKSGIAISVMAVSMIILLKPLPLSQSLSRWAGILGAGIYAGALIPFLFILRDEFGRAWALLALLSTWASDTGAYFVGKAWGRNKLSPALSPKKTIEGMVGGLVASALAGVLVAEILANPEDLMSPLAAAGIGSICALFGVMGDLMESLLKRAGSMKDSSGLIPGHGGFLDRFDALLFAAPVAYMTLRALL